MSELPVDPVDAGEAAGGGKVTSFSFGDPEPVLDRRQILDMLDCPHNGQFYDPPVPLDGLARAFRASPHHSSAIFLKCNLLKSSFVPSRWLDRKTFAKLALDYLMLGNGYLRQVPNRLGDVLRLEHELGKYVRRGVEPGRFFWVPGMAPQKEYEPGTVLQIMQPDVNQEIYGIPEYLSCLQSALLNESATLFRRRYYLNGSHAGYILYASGDINEGDLDDLKEKLRQSKGPGNFRNLLIHAPNAKEGSLKIMPIAEVTAKDEFLGIKNTTRDDILAAHRVPPQMLGIVPAQGSGFGDVATATDAFHRLEIMPLQASFMEINDALGVQAVDFAPYAPMAAAKAA